MPMDSQTPVVVGVAQVLQREDDFEQAREPLELMVEALQRAALDAGSPELLQRAEAVRVVRGVWQYDDPGRVIAERVGCPAARTAITPFGGNFVQTLVNRTCLDIQRGELELALITGAECGRTQVRLRRAGRKPAYTPAPGKPDLAIGADMALSHEAEIARGIRMPLQMYPIFENALRFERGETVSAHLARIGELWAGMSRVAGSNPSAWIRETKTAQEIINPGPGNRAVSFPYPMLMNSNSRVDMGAALILCSEGMADRFGIKREQRVYPHAGSDARDHTFVSERESLTASPAIRLAGRRCLELAGVEASELDHRDLYSCFASAVQVAARELGLDDAQPLTVTGGLTFGGGPLNNYVMHGIARMVEKLRETPGARGLCTANGGFLTKHAFGVYGSAPPETPYRHADLQAEVDALPKRCAVVEHEGEAQIESYTVMYDAEGPQIAHAACLLPDGRRTWANQEDRETATAMTREEFCGRAVRIDGAGNFEPSG